jgi:hypothetical protein
LAAVTRQAVHEKNGQGVPRLLATLVADIEIAGRAGDPEAGGLAQSEVHLGQAAGLRLGERLRLKIREHPPPAGEHGREDP